MPEPVEPPVVEPAVVAHWQAGDWQPCFLHLPLQQHVSGVHPDDTQQAVIPTHPPLPPPGQVLASADDTTTPDTSTIISVSTFMDLLLLSTQALLIL